MAPAANNYLYLNVMTHNNYNVFKSILYLRSDFTGVYNKNIKILCDYYIIFCVIIIL